VIASTVLIGGILLWWSNLQILVGVSRISSAPPATQILSYACLLVFVAVCRAVRFFYDYLLASSDLYFPAPYPEERARWVSRYLPKNIIYVTYFLFVGDFSFIRGRKHECTHKVNKACFCCLLALEIIGHFNKVLYIRPPLHMFTRFHRPILMLDFARQKCFLSHL